MQTRGSLPDAIMYKLVQALSIIAALAGTYLLAFGLKIRPGISDDLRKKLKIEEKDLVSATDIQQRGAFIVWGLVLVTIAALLQLWLILCS